MLWRAASAPRLRLVVYALDNAGRSVSAKGAIRTAVKAVAKMPTVCVEWSAIAPYTMGARPLEPLTQV